MATLNPPVNIIAIGGGDVTTGQTAAIDRELLALTGKPNPHVLFIPTASDDSVEYATGLAAAYGRLGATVENLMVCGEDFDLDRVDHCDAIYVGGGNTKMLIARWREIGLDRRLADHLAKGKPVGGLSAGALCWFRIGNSDWPQYEGIPGVNTARLDCLGFVDLALCPHTRDEGFRLAEFRAMMQEVEGPGVGLDDGCAIQIRDDSYRILNSQAGSVAHLIEWIDGQLTESILPPHSDFRPLASLRG